MMIKLTVGMAASLIHSANASAGYGDPEILVLDPKPSWELPQNAIADSGTQDHPSPDPADPNLDSEDRSTEPLTNGDLQSDDVDDVTHTSEVDEEPKLDASGVQTWLETRPAEANKMAHLRRGYEFFRSSDFRHLSNYNRSNIVQKLIANAVWGSNVLPNGRSNEITKYDSPRAVVEVIDDKFFPELADLIKVEYDLGYEDERGQQILAALLESKAEAEAVMDAFNALIGISRNWRMIGKDFPYDKPFTTEEIHDVRKIVQDLKAYYVEMTSQHVHYLKYGGQIHDSGRRG